MILCNISRTGIESRTFEMFSSMFDTVDELKTWVGKTYANHMNGFSRSIYENYDISVAVSYIDCAAIEYDEGKVHKMITFFDTGHPIEAFDVYIDECEVDPEQHGKYIRVSRKLLNVLEDIRRHTAWYNLQ